MIAKEYNFDGLVGATHNYAGLAYGNRASMKHRARVSNPRAAALQGLEKMKLLFRLGVPQGLIPPQERPSIPHLKLNGFKGSDSQILRSAFEKEPELLSACSSASSMWAANAATVSPSPNTLDHRIHITPANLETQMHRAIETAQTRKILGKIFLGPRFNHHEPLPLGIKNSDEGAANHLRLCPSHGEPGIEVFVYGNRKEDAKVKTRFPARQTLEASQEIAKNHQLNPENVFFIQQNPIAIDAGVFHNDVIAVSNENILFLHEMAFNDQERELEKIRIKYGEIAQDELTIIEVKNSQVDLNSAVGSYLFNSQLVTLQDSSMALIVTEECRDNLQVKIFLEDLLIQDNPISQIHYTELRQSMNNGGGPACLRLRLVMNEEESPTIHPRVLLSEQRFSEIEAWINRNYRDKLNLADFADPQFLDEVRTGLDELTKILELGPIYSFQRDEV